MTRADGLTLRMAVGIVLVITAARLVLLALNRTDLFVDEAQYWLWGQEFAFGYYSKPPLIAWVIGGVTAVMGDTPYWVRAPGAVFHAAAALILMALARRMFGDRIAAWVAVAYATLPMVAVGSLLASTDTIMAPFFCAALYAHRRVVEGDGVRWAALAGAAAGLAFLAKYAAIYFLIGAGLMAVMVPLLRTGWRDGLVMGAAFGTVILPNLLWNLNNDLVTMAHTMDNVGWVRDASPFAGVEVADAAVFFVGQLAVMGPVLFAALIRGAGRRMAGLWYFVAPAISVVTVQALLDKAYANWAVSAYFAGTLIAVAVLIRTPRLLAVGVALNAAISVAIPVMTLAPLTTFGGDTPALARWLGRADLSREILAVATRTKVVAVVSGSRDVLADLFFTVADAGVAVYALPTDGRPAHHYQQRYPLPDTVTGPVLFVDTKAPVCEGVDAPVLAEPSTGGGAYEGEGIAFYLVDAACLRVR